MTRKSFCIKVAPTNVLSEEDFRMLVEHHLSCSSGGLMNEWFADHNPTVGLVWYTDWRDIHGHVTESIVRGGLIFFAQRYLRECRPNENLQVTDIITLATMYGEYEE